MWNFLLFCYSVGGWVWAYASCEPYLTGEARIAIIIVGVIWFYHAIKSRVRPQVAGTRRRLVERGLNIGFNILFPAGLLLFFETCIDKDLTGGTTPGNLRNAYIALGTLLVSNLIYEIQQTQKARKLKTRPGTVTNS